MEITGLPTPPICGVDWAEDLARHTHLASRHIRPGRACRESVRAQLAAPPRSGLAVAVLAQRRADSGAV